MIRFRTLRRLFTVTVLTAVVTVALADEPPATVPPPPQTPTPKSKSPADPKAPKKDEKKMKRPALDANEWKKLGDGGLEVWDVREGDGEPTKKSSTVTIHYTGWLTDAGETMFDSSHKRGKMATFPLDNLIKGWQEGIPGMKPGGVRRLKIPYQLAYGEAGKPPTIPAKATLVFEISMAYGPPKFPEVLQAKQWKPLPIDTPTGIRIWDLAEGEGETVKSGATVTIHYTGWTTNGKKFDSSHDRGKPATFPLAGLIKGWQLAVPGMKVGGVRRMELPYEYAYGEAGSPPDIPPRATLVFEIEVLGTK